MEDDTEFDIQPVAAVISSGIEDNLPERSESPASGGETTVLIERVQDMLENRPAALAGRRSSQTASAAHRVVSGHQTLPVPKRTRLDNDHSPVRPRSNSLGQIRQRTNLVMEDLVTDQETPPTVEIVTEFNRGSTLRQSTNHLRQRVQERRKTMRNMNRAVKASCWSELRYVKWPKVKSRLRVLFSYHLWRGHLKEVEGHFGTFVVSYFVFLRWLFLMNIVIFTLWFGFISVPQIIHEAEGGPSGVNRTSQIACLISPNDTVSKCSNESITSGIILVYSVPDNCTNFTGTGIDVVQVRSCTINNNNIAVGESALPPLRVSSTPVTYSCTQDMLGSGTDSAYTMCVGVQPHTLWYEYIINFFTGQGLFNETLLFHGQYTNQIVRGYDLPLAFILLTGFIYFVSIALLVYKLGNAFSESQVNFRTKKKVFFCNKLFTAWDFNITSPQTAKLRRAHIRTDFQEELEAERARTRKRKWTEWILVIFIRFWTNLFVVVVLIGAGVAIYFSALFELGIINIGVTVFIESYASAIVLSVLNIVLPFLFELVAKLERFKTRSGEINMTLLRTILVRLSSLIVLIATLYIIINCTQPTGNLSNDCSISSFTIVANITTDLMCPECWETFIGQQFYKLGLTNLLLSILATILVETGRNIISKIKWKKIGQRIGKATFNIPKSTLDLIYTQTLLWLGFFFCPLLPAIIFITSLILFYVKKYSLMWNLEPEKSIQRSSRNNFLFLFLILLSLFASVIPVAYAIARLRPSVTCGPFQGQLTMYATITNIINEWNCQARIAVDYFGSAGFIIPLVVFLLLLCYSEYVLLRAKEATIKLVKKQLVLEGANVTHIVDQLDDILQTMVEDKAIKQVEQLTEENPYPQTLDTTGRTSVPHTPVPGSAKETPF